MANTASTRNRSFARSLDLLDINSTNSIDFGTGPSSNPSPLSTLTSPMPNGEETNPRAFSPVKERAPVALPRRQRRWSTTSATMVNMNVSQIYNESFNEVMNNNDNIDNIELTNHDVEEALKVTDYNYDSGKELYVSNRNT